MARDLSAECFWRLRFGTAPGVEPSGRRLYDRLDCQLIMGRATQIYYDTFIATEYHISRPRLLQLVAALAPDEQAEEARVRPFDAEIDTFPCVVSDAQMGG